MADLMASIGMRGPGMAGGGSPSSATSLPASDITGSTRFGGSSGTQDRDSERREKSSPEESSEAPEEGPDSMDSELSMHAESMLAAMESKQPRRFKEALKAFIEACYSEE